MILTDDFVYIHLPKTGGTFATHILSRVYGEDRLTDVAKHGTCSDIPQAYAGKPIVSALRNPYERYVSQYRFEWWKMYPERYCGEAAMRRLFPHYPDLSFAEFLELANTLFVSSFEGRPNGFDNRNFPPEQRPGWHTVDFVRYFFRQPRQVFARLDDEYFDRKLYRQDMFDVRFLRVERLNQDLYDLLVELGHEPGKLEFILSAEKVMPAEGGRTAGDRWQDYYTPELLDFVRTRERLLFELFPELEVPRPSPPTASRRK